MSQEYTEEKDVTLTKLSSGRRLLEALLVVISLFAIYLMAALMSFNPSDPSWSQTAWHEPIHNLGGKTGAWFADTLFFIFGVMAYTIPVIIVGACWFTWRRRESDEYIDYFAVSLRLIGVLAMVLTACGLAAINADDIWYFASGGVIGSLLSTTMMPLLHSSGGTIALLCVWAAGLTLFTGWSWVSIAEKLGHGILSVLTFASNRTRRDNTWQDEEEYEEDAATEDSVSEPAEVHESRRTRILRGALARKKKLSEKFANPNGRKTDAALFSGKRMDDDQDDVLVSRRGAPVDPDDVLFSGNSAAQTDNYDPLFSGSRATQDYDPLLNGQQVAGVTAAALAMPQEQAYSMPVDPELAVPPAQVTAPVTEPVAPEIAWQSMPGPAPAEAAIAPTPEYFTAPAQSVVHQPVQQTEADWWQEPGPVTAYQAPEQQWSPEPVHHQAAYQQPVYQEPEPVYHQPAYQEPESAYQEPVYQEPEPVYPQPAYQQPEQIQPEPEPEEISRARPPMYHFEEVEAQRAREREQLAQWYKPVEEPAPQPYETSFPESRVVKAAAVKPEPEEKPAIPAVSAAAAMAAAAAANQRASAAANSVVPAFGLAGDAPRPQVKEGIGPQLPRPNRVRVPTRRELASYGIKLPSQRQAEEQAQSRHGHYAPEETPGSDEDALQQEELARQFASQQQQRYGQETASQGWQGDDSDHDAAAQAELARQFASQQQQRYAGEQPANAHPFSKDEFVFSPTRDLVDDGPSEPLFTPSFVEPAPQHRPQLQQPAAAPVQPKESLIHPLLMRNGDDRPVQRPTTPLPSLDLLTSPPSEVEPVDTFALEQMARLVEARLADFRIKADVVNYSPGPVITRFELNLAPGVKASRISNLSRDLARSLSTVAVRVVEVIPGKPYVGLELPNKKRQTVYLREVLDCQKFRDSASPLSVVLGKDIAGDPVIADLAKMPHLLVAGTTGSGKSVGVNAMILSMLYKASPEDVKFIMIDPKMLELSVYEGIPHLLTEVVTDMKDAANALRWSVNEMERRYKLMSALGVRNLAGYNEKILEAERMGRPIPDPYWKPGDSMDAVHPTLEKLPYIVVLVDEFADLMMTVGKKVEELIARLAQKARAAGIHLVLATQRPSVDVITGLIKANIPTRIAFTVSSKIDSRTILDQSGAESLLGMGDMLYSGPNSSIPVRVHGAFVRDQEVHAVVTDWKARGRPQYVEGITSDAESEGAGGGMGGDEELDPLFDQAVGFVVEKRKASISGVQRQFRIGYNRAARIIEQMEMQGIVSPQGHNGNREVLAPPPFE